MVNWLTGNIHNLIIMSLPLIILTVIWIGDKLSSNDKITATSLEKDQ